jgi:hypothetical protein
MRRGEPEHVRPGPFFPSVCYEKAVVGVTEGPTVYSPVYTLVPVLRRRRAAKGWR